MTREAERERGRDGGMDGESKRTVEEEERPFLLLPNVLRSSPPPSPLWEYGRALESIEGAEGGREGVGYVRNSSFDNGGGHSAILSTLMYGNFG